MIGKIIGGLAGFFAGGPFGALAGYLVGTVFDSVLSPDKSFYKGKQGGFRRSGNANQDFRLSFIALSAVVMRADGRVLKSELNYVRDFLKKQFGADQLNQNLDLLKAALNKQYSVAEVCYQIKSYMDVSSRSQLVYYLLGIAQADGVISGKEEAEIRNIARHLGITQITYESLLSMFGIRGGRSQNGSNNQYEQRTRTSRPRFSTETDYAILGIQSSASHEEIKKAYRKLAKQYHPDKLRHLSTNHQKSGKEKFQKLVDAYDRIKEARGIK